RRRRERPRATGGGARRRRRFRRREPPRPPVPPPPVSARAGPPGPPPPAPPWPRAGGSRGRGPGGAWRPGAPRAAGACGGAGGGARAIAAGIRGAPAEQVTGRGTGVDDATLARKIAVVRRALEVNRPDPRDGVDVLAKVGGFEIGGLVGVILAGAARRVPVALDGFIAGAAALVAATLAPASGPAVFASHPPAEPRPGHAPPRP